MNTRIDLDDNAAAKLSESDDSDVDGVFDENKEDSFDTSEHARVGSGYEGRIGSGYESRVSIYSDSTPCYHAAHENQVRKRTKNQEKSDHDDTATTRESQINDFTNASGYKTPVRDEQKEESITDCEDITTDDADVAQHSEVLQDRNVGNKPSTPTTMETADKDSETYKTSSNEVLENLASHESTVSIDKNQEITDVQSENGDDDFIETELVAGAGVSRKSSAGSSIRLRTIEEDTEPSASLELTRQENNANVQDSTDNEVFDKHGLMDSLDSTPHSDDEDTTEIGNVHENVLVGRKVQTAKYEVNEESSSGDERVSPKAGHDESTERNYATEDITIAKNYQCKATKDQDMSLGSGVNDTKTTSDSGSYTEGHAENNSSRAADIAVDEKSHSDSEGGVANSNEKSNPFNNEFFGEINDVTASIDAEYDRVEDEQVFTADKAKVSSTDLSKDTANDDATDDKAAQDQVKRPLSSNSQKSVDNASFVPHPPSTPPNSNTRNNRRSYAKLKSADSSAVSLDESTDRTMEVTTDENHERK